MSALAPLSAFVAGTCGCRLDFLPGRGVQYQSMGLAMLGVRPGRTWVTRLGVLPNRRRRGTGEALVRALLETPRMAQAVPLLRELAAEKPDNEWYVLTLARCQIGLRHLEEARALLESTSAETNRSPQVQLLFAELAFAGNSEDYYNPENSLLPCVLETRLGLPITLSLVYKLVADKLGLGVWGVGLPGHFVAGTSMNGRLVFVDSFGGGRLLSVNDARTRVASQFGETIPWSDRLIEPVSNRYWVTRILQNLLSAYSRSGQFSELAAVLEMA